MTQAWYQVLSLGFGYISAAIIVMVVLLSLRIRRRIEKLQKKSPQRKGFPRRRL